MGRPVIVTGTGTSYDTTGCQALSRSSSPPMSVSTRPRPTQSATLHRDAHHDDLCRVSGGVAQSTALEIVQSALHLDSSQSCKNGP